MSGKRSTKTATLILGQTIKRLGEVRHRLNLPRLDKANREFLAYEVLQCISTLSDVIGDLEK